MNRKNLFISYVSTDAEFKQTLVSQLTILALQGSLGIMDVERISPGMNTEAEIRNMVETCDIAVVLVSSDYLASNIVETQLNPLLRRRELGELWVIPVIVRPCLWKESPLKVLQPFPKTGTDIKSALYPERLWALLTGNIRDILSNMGVCPAQPGVDKVEGKVVDLYHLPQPTTKLVGRRDELTTIDRAFNNKPINIVGIIAPGGIGKSALVHEWLERMAPSYNGAKWVLGWSFYSQGTHDTQTSSSLFFEHALRFFGQQEPLPSSDEDKARQLAALVRERPSIIVLDGIEPLQHGPDIHNGELADTGLKTFLRDIRAHNLPERRILVISSRQPIVELKGSDKYHEIELDRLSQGDGVLLLKQLGVKGTPPDLMQAVQSYSGHPLALVLLSNILVEWFDSNVSQHWQMPQHLNLTFDETAEGAQVRRVLEFYAQRWAADAPELAFLHLLGLFDRPLAEAERQVLLAKADVAAPLRNLNEVEWKRLFAHLRKLGLLLEEKHAPGVVHWDTHPLLRSYFGQTLCEQHPEQWQQAQHILFEHFQAMPDVENPSLIDLEPLYRAVHHGCLAGLYTQALNLYQQRIRRDPEAYSVKKLGAYAQDLTALVGFFQQPWSVPHSQLTETRQLWVLGQVAFYLMSLGRLYEAIAPRQAHIKLAQQREDWTEATIAASNLCDLRLPLGELDSALQAAQQSLQWAQQADDAFHQMASHSRIATVLHRQGQLSKALETFAVAEQIQAAAHSTEPLLYSVQGARYCEALLDHANDLKAKQAVLQRVEIMLNRQEVPNSLLTEGFNQLTLGRVQFALDHIDIALTALNAAVQAFEQGCKLQYLPECLLQRAEVLRYQGDYTAAQMDIDYAQGIISNSKMQLYQIDAWLSQANLLLDKKFRDKSRTEVEGVLPPRVGIHPTDDVLDTSLHYYKQAEPLVNQLGYGIRQVALDLLAARLAHHGRISMVKQDAHVYLAQAKNDIEAVGCWRLLPEWENIRAELDYA